MRELEALISVEPHASLAVVALEAASAEPISTLTSPDWLLAWFALDADAPLSREESVRTAIRDLLRAGGYRPTGRGKPASEYLARAAGDGALGSINPVVDACNAVSLHSGFPISVVDADLGTPPWRIAVAPAGASYVFNASGQAIDLAGLLTVFDAHGPCAGPVKDSQRTKTTDSTRRALSVIWGTRDLAERLDRSAQWYAETLSRLGMTVERIATRADT